MRLSKIVWVFSLLLILRVPASRAQEQQNTPGGYPPNGVEVPIQPLSPAEAGNRSQKASSSGAADASTGNSGAQLDTHPLSSAETFGLGFLRGARNVFDPAVFVFENGDSQTRSS